MLVKQTSWNIESWNYVICVLKQCCFYASKQWIWYVIHSCERKSRLKNVREVSVQALTTNHYWKKPSITIYLPHTNVKESKIIEPKALTYIYIFFCFKKYFTKSTTIQNFKSDILNFKTPKNFFCKIFIQLSNSKSFGSYCRHTYNKCFEHHTVPAA